MAPAAIKLKAIIRFLGRIVIPFTVPSVANALDAPFRDHQAISFLAPRQQRSSSRIEHGLVDVRIESGWIAEFQVATEQRDHLDEAVKGTDDILPLTAFLAKRACAGSGLRG